MGFLGKLAFTFTAAQSNIRLFSKLYYRKWKVLNLVIDTVFAIKNLRERHVDFSCKFKDFTNLILVNSMTKRLIATIFNNAYLIVTMPIVFVQGYFICTHRFFRLS